MLKGGVIMDVTNAEQAQIAEEAGACAVMALERVPSDIRKEGGVARMASPRDHPRNYGHRVDSRDGQGAHRPFRGSAGARSAGSGLHRRKRSAHARRRGKSRVEARFQGSVRLRRAQSGRSAAAHRRRRGDDPHQGRSGLGQHRRGGAPHARDRRPDAEAHDAAAKKSWCTKRKNSARRSNWSRGSRSTASCPCRIFRRAESRLPPMRRW